MTLVGRRLLQPLRDPAQIARGGMAEVFLARDQLLDRPVALKVLFPGVRARPVLRRAVPPRGPERRQPQPPQHRRRLRLGPGARHVLHRHGVRRRPLAARPHPREGPLDAEAGRRDRRRDRGCARVRAPQRRRAPRREARQRAHRPPTATVKVTDFGIARADATRRRSRRPARSWAPPPTSRPSRRRASRSTAAPTCTRSASCSTRWSPGAPPFTGDCPVAVAYKHVREEPMPPTPARTRRPARPRADHPHRAGEGPRPPVPVGRRPARRPAALRPGRVAVGGPITGKVTELPATPPPRSRSPSWRPPRWSIRSRSRSSTTTGSTDGRSRIAGGRPIVASVIGCSCSSAPSPRCCSPPTSAAGATRRRRSSRSQDVINRPFDQAKRILVEQGFEVRRVDEKSTQPPDVVLDQRPGPDDNLEKGETVMLTVSDPDVQIPTRGQAAHRRHQRAAEPRPHQHGPERDRERRGQRPPAGQGAAHRARRRGDRGQGADDADHRGRRQGAADPGARRAQPAVQTATTS